MALGCTYKTSNKSEVSRTRNTVHFVPDLRLLTEFKTGFTVKADRGFVNRPIARRPFVNVQRSTSAFILNGRPVIGQ